MRTQDVEEKNICPHCGSELDHLLYEQRLTQFAIDEGTARLDGEILESNYSEVQDYDIDEEWFKCPECETTIDPGDLITMTEAIENGIIENEEEEPVEEKSDEDVAAELNSEWINKESTKWTNI